MTLTFATPDTVGGAYTIDLSQAASLANRRFYRQGINWAVASVKVLSNSTGTVQLYKLPTTGERLEEGVRIMDEAYSTSDF
jgi:hypothetical protein